MNAHDIPNPGEDDRKVETAVLLLLLALHPAQLSAAELSREVSGGDGGFRPADAVERAIDELAAAGLAHRAGELVVPSRAALRLERLLG